MSSFPITKRIKKHLYAWQACDGCRNERWVMLIGGKLRATKCISCAAHSRKQTCSIGSNNAHWKGGYVLSGGYMKVKLQPDDFYFSMANTVGYILEHRLVMAKYLKRHLQRWEMVHHRNRNKLDNRLENLEIVMADNHRSNVRCPHCRKEFKIQ